MQNLLALAFGRIVSQENMKRPDGKNGCNIKKGGTVEWQEVNGRRFWQQVYAALWQQVFWQAAAVEAEVEAAVPAVK